MPIIQTHDLVKIYQWSNFDTTIDRLIAEQPKDWLPKEFTSYADLLRACHRHSYSLRYCRLHFSFRAKRRRRGLIANASDSA